MWRLGVIVGIAIAFALAASARAESVFPDTGAGRSLRLFLQIVNQGDAAMIARYNATYRRSLTLDVVKKVRAISGGYDLVRIEQSEPTRIVALISERNTGDKLRRVVTDTPADPTTASEGNGERLGDLHLSEAVAVGATVKYAELLAARDFFSGSVLIASRGKTLLERNWGWADRASREPVTADTRFRIASMGKMFTGIAALQLVAEGKLVLDRAVGNYLPSYPNKEIAAKVTVRMLLNNTGGTGEIFGPQFAANRLQLKDNGDYVKLYGARAPEFSPGSRDGYSNYGFILLGLIIEKVAGQSYDAYVRQHIFLPAEMGATGALPEVEHVFHRSPGYVWHSGRWVSNADTLPWQGTAAGGGYTTLHDLLNFSQALQDGRLLPPRLLTQAISPQNYAGDYGFGFMLGGRGTSRWYGYSAAAPGSDAEFRVYPALQKVIVVLSNLDPPFATAIAEYYYRHMPNLSNAP